MSMTISFTRSIPQPPIATANIAFNTITKKIDCTTLWVVLPPDAVGAAAYLKALKTAHQCDYGGEHRRFSDTVAERDDRYDFGNTVDKFGEP